MAKAADGKALQARKAAAAAALVALLAAGAGALWTAPVGTADVDGDTPPVMGAGGEHYGEGWNNYGHAVDR